MPDTDITKHRNTKFSNNVTATLRQEPGIHAILCGGGDDYTGNGLARIENRFGRLRMKPKTARNGDTDNTDISSTTRWIRPGRLNTVAPLADLEDFQETMVDLGSPLVKEVGEAATTYHDDMAIRGFFGNGYQGKEGEEVVPFKPTNVIAHGGTGLTLDKLKALRETCRKRNAPFKREAPIILLHPEDETDLLGIEEYKNSDYSGSTPLVQGEIKPFMGFRFLPVNPDEESFPEEWGKFFADNGATRQLPVVFPSGLHRGRWVEFMGKIDQLPGKDYSWQYWGAARSAVVRTDEDLAFILQTR